MKCLHSNKLDDISKGLKRFIYMLLDLCEGKRQVEIFLGQDDDINGISIKGSTMLPRYSMKSKQGTMKKPR